MKVRTKVTIIPLIYTSDFEGEHPHEATDGEAIHKICNVIFFCDFACFAAFGVQNLRSLCGLLFKPDRSFEDEEEREGEDDFPSDTQYGAHTTLRRV